jgi:hypothetical protein
MTPARTGPAFSVRDIPFSRAGSWFGLSPVIAENTYADDLHLVSHQTGMHPVLRLVPVLGRERAETELAATPSRLAWTRPGPDGPESGAGPGTVELAYESPDTVLVRGEGLGLRLLAANPVLTPFSGTYLYRDPVDGAYVFTVYETGRRYRITVLAGHDDVQADGVQLLGVGERGLTLGAAGGSWEIAVEEYESARPPYRRSSSFGQVADAAQAEFDAFAEAVAPWRSERTPAADLAAYVLWSATVRPAGFLHRPGVLMSKHWMDKVWSWDHCFNALALAEGLPAPAWDQFALPFDHQDPGGALPDSVTHSEVLYNYVKPPIHGWALHRLRSLMPEPARDQLAEAYSRLERWTRFWLTARRAPGRALPHYHHGNDSGWDNATTFDPQRVVESADLAAFLVLQLRTLAQLADDLGDAPAAAQWTKNAHEMQAALLEQLWDGDRFITRPTLGGVPAWTSSSLLDLMPIVLGADLPPEVAAALARRIETHLTPYGLATEHPSSPHYQEDGYWRGPIWAPSTVLIEDGLRRAGYADLADEISARFLRLCESAGFAENFGAQTGAALRDRAYTWTASAYLILAAAHERRTARQPSSRPQAGPQTLEST